MITINNIPYPDMEHLHFARNLLMRIKEEQILDRPSEAEEDLVCYCNFLKQYGYPEYSNQLCRAYCRLKRKGRE